MSEMDNEVQGRCQELIDPIVSVFGGKDGGVSFVRFRHMVLPAIITGSANNEKVLELLDVITRFSNLCKKLPTL